MSTTMSEMARIMVAQGRMTQEQYDRLFGPKDAARGGGGQGQVDAVGGERSMPGVRNGLEQASDVQPAVNPSPRERGGKDAAAGPDTAEGHADEFDEPY